MYKVLERRFAIPSRFSGVACTRSRPAPQHLRCTSIVTGSPPRALAVSRSSRCTFATMTDAATTTPEAPTAVAAAAKDVKVTVHWLNQSRSQRILWLLEEAHLPYEVEVYHRQPSMLAPPELKSIHPLGKSPVVTISGPGLAEPMVLAESGFLTEYIVDHFAPHLKPQQWQAGREGQLGGETAEWLRYRYYMHYNEGSLMPPLVMQLIPPRIKSAPAPFFVKPIMRIIGDRMGEQLLPMAQAQFDFLESELASAPQGGPYMCGSKLTAADILLSFPIGAARKRLGLTKEKYPHIYKYMDLLDNLEANKRAVKRIEGVEGKPLEDVDL